MRRSGYLLVRWGQLPQDGERIEGADGALCFEILETEGRRIGKVRITGQQVAEAESAVAEAGA